MTSAWKIGPRAQRIVRRSAHLVEYGVLALLAFRAWRLSLERDLLSLAVLALALVLAVASADETRQSLSSARTGSARDVVWDLSGAVLALGLLFAHQRAWGGPRVSSRTGS
jgi:VanZ family protein